MVAWNDHAAAVARAACVAPFDNPLHESRMYAMMHVAVHDALNAVSRRSQPYVYRGKTPGASPEAAVAAAARTSLLGAVADIAGPFVPCHDAAVTVVEDFYTEALKSIPDGSAKLPTAMPWAPTPAGRRCARSPRSPTTTRAHP